MIKVLVFRTKGLDDLLNPITDTHNVNFYKCILHNFSHNFRASIFMLQYECTSTETGMSLPLLSGTAIDPTPILTLAAPFRNIAR